MKTTGLKQVNKTMIFIFAMSVLVTAKHNNRAQMYVTLCSSYSADCLVYMNEDSTSTDLMGCPHN